MTEPVHPEAQALLARGARVDVGDEHVTPEELRRRVADVDVILSKTDPVPIDSEVIDAAPRLRLIARHGSGYSNVDVDHATGRGIVVTNTPGVNAVTIAEYTVGLMIAAARRLVPAASACRAGAPDRLGFLGHELSGKTFGIVGVGRIGREVVRRVSALGMRVIAHHPRPSARGLADLPLALVDLDTLLEESDVVSLHVPLNEQTRNLIGARELASMKPTAILLNLSRGGVVDEGALYDALERGAIDAAATDVLAVEPVSAAEPLLRLDNCLVLRTSPPSPLRRRRPSPWPRSRRFCVLPGDKPSGMWSIRPHSPWPDGARSREGPVLARRTDGRRHRGVGRDRRRHCPGVRPRRRGSGPRPPPQRRCRRTHRGGSVRPGVTARSYRVDVTDAGGVRANADRIVADFGAIHILLNSAGGNLKSAITDADTGFFDLAPQAIQDTMALNFMGGAVLPCLFHGARMVGNEHGGAIVNISSMNAVRPLEGRPAYAASKAAVSNFTQWLACHVARHYTPLIRVNAIAPGFFPNERMRASLFDDDGSYNERARRIIDHTPMGRLGRADDLVGTALWYASDASRFVTGTVTPVDGGFSAYGGV